VTNADANLHTKRKTGYEACICIAAHGHADRTKISGSRELNLQALDLRCLRKNPPT
jgi:hypothetical protein